MPGFQVVGGSDTYVHSFAMQPSGKFLIAGLESVSNSIAAIERRNSDGSPDPMFGDGGSIFPAGLTLQNATPLLVLPNSNFLVGDDLVNDSGVSYLGLEEFSSDGKESTSTPFSVLGPDLGQFAEQFESIGSGSAVVAISIQAGDPNDYVVSAIVSGVSIVSEVQDTGVALRLQEAPYVSGVSSNQEWLIAVGVPAFVVRLDLDGGSFDTIFEATANASIASLGVGSILGVVVDGDSKSAMAIKSTEDALAGSMLLIRIDQDGLPDTLFGDGGIVGVAIGSRVATEVLASQSDGKLVVAGQVGTQWVIARFWP